MDFIGEIIAKFGPIPTAITVGVIVLMFYSIIKGGKGGKGGNGSSSSNNTPTGA